MPPKPTRYYFEWGQRLQGRYWAHYGPILARYPDTDSGPDVRPALLGMPGNALVGYLLAMSAIETMFNKYDWWEHHTPYREEAEIQELVKHYEQSIRQGFYVLFASRYEWAIRNLLANLDGAAADGGLAVRGVSLARHQAIASAE